MKIGFTLICIIVLMITICGCVDRGPPGVNLIEESREFIKDYIKNPETIVFNNETIISHTYGYDIYGSGKVLYEGDIKNFSYYIFAQYNVRIKKVDYILKQLIIGET